MMLRVYGDFNCPFSALASVQVDELLRAGMDEIEWRAVQHDTSIPAGGEPVEGETYRALEAEIATVLELSEGDVGLQLAVPPIRSNTALACAAFAAAGPAADHVRRTLYAAVWTEGRNLGDAAELGRLGASVRDHSTARLWQKAFESLPRPVTPTLVLPDGYVSRGLGALDRLAHLTAAARHPERQ